MNDSFAPIEPLPNVWDVRNRIGEMLKGKRGLIVGMANRHSIAYGCAAKLHAFGAELALSYINEKTKVYVEPIARELEATLLLPLNVERQGELEAVFARIREEWGGLDFVVHSIGFAPPADLRGRVVDCSLDGFVQAMRVSVYSFIEMARLAEPLMPRGGVLVTMSYYGADKVVDHYNIMGPVKAALESSTRYLAAELGAKGIRVYALSPGPLRTRAGKGIADFDDLVSSAIARSPVHRTIDIAEIGRVVAFLVGPGASGMTGDTIYVDGGRHNVA